MVLNWTKLKPLPRAIAAVFVLAVVAFLGANVVDYLRFTRAMARAMGLTRTELIVLGDYAKSITRENAGRPNETPLAFQPLKPIDVSLSPGCSEATLYRLGEIYLDISVDTSPNNQHVYFFTNSAGPQKTKSLWIRDPSLEARLSPTNRLLTISQMTMHERIEWIVLRDQILVVNRSYFTSKGDSLLASIPFSESERASIEAQIRSIPSESRGKSYRDEGVMDGITLSIAFTRDGKAGRDSIVVGNTWTDAIGPLLECVSRFSPKEHPIKFKSYVTDDRVALNHRPPTVRPLEEWRAMLAGKPQTPWWCVWRSLIRRDEADY